MEKFSLWVKTTKEERHYGHFNSLPAAIDRGCDIIKDLPDVWAAEILCIDGPEVWDWNGLDFIYTEI